MNKIKVAKELIKLAKSLVSSRQFDGEFHYNKSRNEITIILNNCDDVKYFVATADYKQMQSWFINAEGGVRDFTIKNGKASAQFVLNSDNEDTKSHSGEIINNLKQLGLEKK